MSFSGRLDVLILHFNRADLLAHTLTRLNVALEYGRSPGPTTVWVLDNGSDALARNEAWATVRSLAAAHPDRFRWAESGENLGFARGMNLLWVKSRPTGWVLLLNSDTDVDPHFVHNLRSHLPAPNSARFFTPMIEEGGKLSWGGTMQLWRGTARMSCASQPQREFASGAALLLPAPLLPFHGPWNDAFYFYGEDVELSWRLRQAGWSLGLLPLVVKHVGRGSLSAERAIELHFAGRAMVISETQESSLVGAVFELIVTLELIGKSLLWSATGRRQIVGAAWRGWAAGVARAADRSSRAPARERLNKTL